MKILKIEFRNINSLRGTNLIDFTAEPFTTNSLFAITGPTGSGKSTILDVISLALFNQVPRLGKISRNEIISKGAILTRNQQEAFAKVTYESKTGVYTSHWNISTARTGNLREYEMEIINEATGNILDLKKSDVPSKNEELIGLNYNQFIKSVLLAQGEFAQFLKAKKDERGELLEKITGTGIYRQLGRMAFEKFKMVNVEIQKQQDTMEIIRKDLLQEEQVIDLREELQQKENKCKPLEEELKGLDRNLQLKKTIEEQLKEIDNLSAERESAEVSLKEFVEANGLRIQQHEKVRDFAEELRDWSRLTRECAGLDKDFGGKRSRREENILEIQNCLKDVSGFTKLEIAQEEVEERLQEFATKVREIQNELDQKLVEYKRLQDVFHTETRELPCKLNEKDPEGTKQQLEDLRKSAQTKISELKEDLKSFDLLQPDVERERLRKDLMKAREAQAEAEKLNRTSSEIARLYSEEEKLQPLIKDLPGEIQEKEKKVSSLKDKIEIITLKRQNQMLLASFEDQRIHLQDGEPCPLCGAENHPFANDLPPKDHSLDRELKTAEEEFSSLNGKLAAAKATLAHHESNLREVDSQKIKLAEELQIREKEFSEKYKHLQNGEQKEWKEICDRLDNLLYKLDQYERQNRSLTCVEIGLPLINQMREVSSQGKELREKLTTIYIGKDINFETQRFQTRWTKLRELDKAIGEQLVELQEKIEKSGKELKDLEKQLNSRVTAQGFESISVAGESLLPDPEYYRLHSQRDKIQKLIDRNNESLRLLNSQLEKSKKGDVEQSAEELRRMQQEKLTAFENVQNECQNLKRRLLNDRENRVRIRKIKEEIAEKEKQIKRWRLLNELIGDSTGKKFNDFAQDLSLSQLLQLANIRLKDLSDRYRIDKPGEEEDDGLVAIDEHMGGQRRSVKTLSGGETFILSLSMALALSDLASKNVEINSLFIDEGFGTLDPETLDQTLDTLEKLQAESSKTIGIISHVDSLKERIATQIQLTRNGQGYSSLKVIG